MLSVPVVFEHMSFSGGSNCSVRCVLCSHAVFEITGTNEAEHGSEQSMEVRQYANNGQ